jgi:hypothetical protein
MRINLQITAVIIGLVFFILPLIFLKRNSLHPSYAVLWLGVSLFLLTIPVLGSFYQFLAKSILGVSGGDHVIYIGMIGFLLGYVFYLTSKICQMSDRISKLISSIAILEHEVRKERVR